MGRKSPPAAVDAVRQSYVFGRNLAALVVHHDEVQACSFEKACELVDPRVSGHRFRLHNDVVGYARARRELALAQVCERARSANISICRKLGHVLSVADFRASDRIGGATVRCRNCRCGQSDDHSCERFALPRRGSRAKRREKSSPSGGSHHCSRLLAISPSLSDCGRSSVAPRFGGCVRRRRASRGQRRNGRPKSRRRVRVTAPSNCRSAVSGTADRLHRPR